jgi:hypothetical protein
VARQVLEAAAVLDPALDDALLQQTSARSAAETADALDELLAQQFLQIEPQPPSSLAFPHRLMQIAVYRELTPWRRKLLHRRAADAFGPRAAAQPGCAGQHYVEAGAWELGIALFAAGSGRLGPGRCLRDGIEPDRPGFDLLPHLAQPNPTRLACCASGWPCSGCWCACPAGSPTPGGAAPGRGRARRRARLDALEAQISLHVLLSDFDQAEATAGQALALAQQTGRPGG